MPSDRREPPSSNERRDSRSDEPRVELGRIVGPHGLRGQVRVRFFGDSPDHLATCREIWLGEQRDCPKAKPYEARFAGTGRANEARLALEGVTDRDAAQALRGLLVLADPSILERLEGDEFYWHQLIGCQVETETGASVGAVQEIWETGAHDVLVVRDEQGRQNLIPTAREFTREIDLPGRRIVVETVPGLLDLGEGPRTED